MKKRNTQAVKRHKTDHLERFLRDLEKVSDDYGKAQTVPELRCWLVRLLTVAAQIGVIIESFDRRPPADPAQREAIASTLNNSPLKNILKEALITLEKLEMKGGVV